MNRFLHIGVNYGGTPVRPEVIDQVLSRVVADWMRYSPCCWVIWTDLTAEALFQQLKPAISLSDSIFIAALSVNDRAGFMPGWAWEWIDSKRAPQPLPVDWSQFKGTQLGNLLGKPSPNAPTTLGGLLGPFMDQPKK